MVTIAHPALSPGERGCSLVAVFERCESPAARQGGWYELAKLVRPRLGIEKTVSHEGNEVCGLLSGEIDRLRHQRVEAVEDWLTRPNPLPEVGI